MKLILKNLASGLVVALGLAVVAPVSTLVADQNQIPVPAQSEQLIQRQVVHELRMLPYYSIFDNLNFRVEGNTVVLSGQVVNPVLKSDAGNVVKHVEGVQQVVNNIQVLPLSNFDWQIRRAEERAIYRSPGFEKYYSALPPIHIIVDNGHVTLLGVVDSNLDKNMAGIRANSVPGVFSVTNDLVVSRS